MSERKVQVRAIQFCLSVFSFQNSSIVQKCYGVKIKQRRVVFDLFSSHYNKFNFEHKPHISRCSANKTTIVTNKTWSKQQPGLNIETHKQVFFVGFFSVQLLSVLRGHSFFSSLTQRPITSDFEGFYPLHYFLILILEKEPVFPFSMSSAKQENYLVLFFITSLV